MPTAFNMASQHPLPESYQHKRTKSSVLSFMHKRTPSNGATLPSHPPHGFIATPQYESAPILPPGHPHSRALGELQNHQTPPLLPLKSREPKRPTTSDDGPKFLHKKTLSSISLKGLRGDDSEKAQKSKDSKIKSMKSQVNLSNLLSRPKSTKNLKKQATQDEARAQKDKENRSPATSSPVDATRPPPIYAQFSSEYFTKQPLGGKFLEDEIDRYTPSEYGPGKQRNFFVGLDTQSSLTKRDEAPQRPKSTYLPSSFSIQDIARKVSEGSRHSAEIVRRVSGGKRPSYERNTTASSTKSEKSAKAVPQKKPRETPATTSPGKKSPKDNDSGLVIQDKDVAKEFEAMLDRRNIPEHQRGKMRSLAMSMKKDFIRQDWAEIAAAKHHRPGTNRSDSSAEATSGTHDVPEVKTKRPRSRTFTLSRSSSKEPPSPTKKSKAETGLIKGLKKSSENLKEGNKSFTASGAAVAQTLIAKAKGQLTDDYVSYLRKVRKPELVEVGKLHKLRLLLRNETVAWTDNFIAQGGMEEIVGLLHRTMEVEWREEHEDALLHEVLLCLKALATTALALEHLDRIQRTLFPAILHLLFDENKKGPSEFTTRNIISSLLFTYLKSAPLSERTNRAKILLSYLRDPEPSESQRPVEFVLDMQRSRPYRVWCKEVVNVTKEVFWIFLHNLNVIAGPGGTKHGDHSHPQDTINSNISSGSSSSFDRSNTHHIYMERHFPKERPPVPAAPYVGGVEWDATNYLASHLDIVNGIIASLPTQAERNTLREQMLVSGWEKCLGGTLRMCKEKFYGGVHDGLRCWVAAAHEDDWDTRDVRCGPYIESSKSPRKSPTKRGAEDAPKIEMKLDFLAGAGKVPNSDDIWL